MTFLALLADKAGHSLHFERLEPEPFLAAMVASFRGENADLAAHIRRLVDAAPASR